MDPPKANRKNFARKAVMLPFKPIKMGASKIRSVSPANRKSRTGTRPIDGEKPVAVLRVQVISGKGLAAKDKNGSSDPFVVASFPPTRASTSVIKKTLDPAFPPNSSTFDFPIFLSMAKVGRLGSLELVVWDKDVLKKDYLGECALPIAEWFPEGKALPWSIDSEVLSRDLLSTRRRSLVTGSIQVRLGFLTGQDSASSSDDILPPLNYEDVYDQLRSLSSTKNIMNVAPHIGIGTIIDEEDVQYIADDGLSESSGESGEEEGEDDFYLAVEERPEAEETVPEPTLLAPPAPPLQRTSSGGLMSPRPLLLTPKRLSFLGRKSTKSTPIGTPTAKLEGSEYFNSATTLTQSPSLSPAPGAKKKAKSSSNRLRRGGNEWSLSAEKDILGIVMIEVVSAEGLPRVKSLIGFDMDPFVVCAFGRKIFRTRVIRHSLNPIWNEKLLFHVRNYQSKFTVAFNVLDWDKITGNDAVGDALIPISELIELAPKPNEETGLYSPDEDGKHDMKEFRLPLIIDGKYEDKPVLTVRAKFEPYDALRQRFWREYIKSYDAGNDGLISFDELTMMLDSLGSTLTHRTLESYFEDCGLDPQTDNLTVDQLIIALESEIVKPSEEKGKVEPEQTASLQTTNSVSPEDDQTLTEAIDPFDQKFSHNMQPLGFTGPSVNTLNPEKEQNEQVSLTTGSDTASALHSMSLKGQPAPAPSSPDEEEDDLEDALNDDVERVINIRVCPLCHRQKIGRKTEVDIISHIAVCASTDWNRVNRILVGNFVTSSQAQRKFITNMFSKVSSGAYRLGANSANILVQDRASGQLMEEKMAIYVRLGIRVLYKGNRSTMEGSRAKRLLKSMSIKQGIKYDSEESVAEIPGFIAFHKLVMDEVLDPIESFKTFNQFFFRKLKPTARPVENPDDKTILVSPADCRMMAFDSVDSATQLWIKGREFTVKRLLGERYGKESEKYERGAVGIFRLAPQDYHRFHSPVDGIVGEIEKIEGAYFTVNPQAIRTALDVYGENVRTIVPIKSSSFGTVMCVCVGAMMVGSIVHTKASGDSVARGEEFGYFAFGGSTLVVLFEEGVLKWDEDLRQNSKQCVETLVRCASNVGKCLKPSM